MHVGIVAMLRSVGWHSQVGSKATKVASLNLVVGHFQGRTLPANRSEGSIVAQLEDRWIDASFDSHQDG